ncbi:MAG TPA: hypothetical protein VFV98_07310 [Vicinamibacterales bacterium]|nr:hypothetical protein [Vicinamibacterales bacterium]
MFPRPARIALVVLAFGALPTFGAAQAQSTPTTTVTAPAAPAAPAPDVNLSGTWKFDAGAIKDDPRNWRRPVQGQPAVPGAIGGVGVPPEGGGSTGPLTGATGGGIGDPAVAASTTLRPPRSAGSLGEPWDSQVRRALRDLLEVTPLYTITVEPAQVTFVDDLDRTFVYMTDGRKEKKRASGTEFDVRTTWEGNVLRQDIVASALRMSQAFMLTSDQSAMFVWLTVEKPELVPPIKKLARVYMRVK